MYFYFFLFFIYLFIYLFILTMPGDTSNSQRFVPLRNRIGWMDDLRFYVLFNSISVISGRCLDDNERLCAMGLRLRLRRFHLE